MKTESKLDNNFLEVLHKKQKALENTLEQRRAQKQRAHQMFVEHVRKEMDMLISEQEKMDARNQQLRETVNQYTKKFSKLLPEIMQAEDKLKDAKIKYLSYIEKQIPE